MQKISSALAAQRFKLHRTVNRRLCDVGMKAYGHRKTLFWQRRWKPLILHGLSYTV